MPFFPDGRPHDGVLAHAKNYKEGKHKYYGRFNQGVVTLNLVDAACSSGGDEKKFWRSWMSGWNCAIRH